MKTALMILCVALVLFSSGALSSPLNFDKEWTRFKNEFNKTYNHPIAEQQRRSIWQSTFEKVNEHNKRFRLGLVTYFKRIYKFSDLTFDEFATTHFGLRTPANVTEPAGRKIYKTASNGIENPDSLDWRDRGAVTEVKNQNPCGSCWAFSATGAMEGQMAIQDGNLVSLSEQNLMDCIGGDNDCNSGSNPDNAFNWVMQNGGIDTEDSYPYEFHGDSCRFNPENIGAQVTGITDVEQGNEDALVDAIANAGPVSVGVAALDDFIAYGGGVFSDSSATCDRVNHAVLAVGYGSDNGQDLYIIKNSWGTGWGESGYMRLARNDGNNCCVAGFASFPQVA